MNNLKKCSALVLIFCCLSVFGNAQSAYMEKKADERVAEIDKAICSINPDLALTLEQRKEIKELHLKRSEELKEVKNNDLTEEVMTAKRDAIIKDFNQTLNKEVLTREQVNAKREAKNKG